MNRLFKHALILSIVVALSACDEDEPQKEDTPELITKVTLVFTPTSGTTGGVTVTANDPDGIGVLPIAADGPIALKVNTTYKLSISLINGLLNPGEDGYDVTSEVEDEGDEHQFFFKWTEGIFSNPAGTGNILSAANTTAGNVNYTGATNSVDNNNLPLGLTTTWTTSGTAIADKVFQIQLKHQPGLKSKTSTSNDGETDADLTFTINLVN